MKFTVQRQEFLDALKEGGSMAGRSKTLPILNYAKVAVSTNGSLLISSCDGEVGIVRRGNVLHTEEDCSFCVQPKELGDILNTIKDEQVIFNTDSTSLYLTHSKGVVTIPIMGVEDFIGVDNFVMPNAEEKDYVSIKVSANEMYGCLKNARTFCGTDEIRPTLTGILLKIEGDKVMVASSDAHKLYVDGFSLSDASVDKMESIIPNKAVRPIMDALYSAGDVTMQITGTSMRVITSTTAITTKLIIGKYPDVARLIFSQFNLEVVAKKDDLMESLSRTLLSADAASRLVKMSISEGEPMTLVSEDLGFSKSSKDSVKVECDPVSMPIGWDFRIGVKGSFLMDCVSAISSQDVVFRFIDSKKAILMLDKERESKKIILMPVMLN